MRRRDFIRLVTGAAAQVGRSQHRRNSLSGRQDASLGSALIGQVHVQPTLMPCGPD